MCTRDNARENCDIVCFTDGKRGITILNHATGNSEANNRNRKTGYTLHTSSAKRYSFPISLAFFSLKRENVPPRLLIC